MSSSRCCGRWSACDPRRRAWARCRRSSGPWRTGRSPAGPCWPRCGWADSSRRSSSAPWCRTRRPAAPCRASISRSGRTRCRCPPGPGPRRRQEAWPARSSSRITAATARWSTGRCCGPGASRLPCTPATPSPSRGRCRPPQAACRRCRPSSSCASTSKAPCSPTPRARTAWTAWLRRSCRRLPRGPLAPAPPPARAWSLGSPWRWGARRCETAWRPSTAASCTARRPAPRTRPAPRWCSGRRGRPRSGSTC
mmetsp:Transcript_55509/g.149691  ORF Transcript_55509/g.149691 Transcript_55509/m.149691 type:complete len:252 (-) Transcript_55509:30-785(-)